MKYEANPASGGSSARCILVVDDNRDCASSLAMLLQYDGHDVHVANSGLAAIEIAEQFRPDIIFMDIRMPDVDGFEVARKIRSQSWARNIMIFAVSAYVDTAIPEQYEQAGFDHQWAKPTNFDEIARLLRRESVDDTGPP